MGSKNLSTVESPRSPMPPGGMGAIESGKTNGEASTAVGFFHEHKVALIIAVAFAVSISVAVPLVVVLLPDFETETESIVQLQAQFTYLEDCASYDLDFCSAGTRTTQPFENVHMRLQNDIWWFEDSVLVQAKQQEKNGEVLWYVRTTISFGHDPLNGMRKKVFVARMTSNYTVTGWKTYELINGTRAFRCDDRDASQWPVYETYLVESMLRETPMLLLRVQDEEDESPAFEFEDVERNGTFGMIFNRSDFENQLNMTVLQSLDNSTDEVNTEISGLNGPSFIFEDIVVTDNNETAMEWEDVDFFDVECEDYFDLDWNDTLDLSEEVPARSSIKTPEINETGSNSTFTTRRRLRFTPAGSDNWQSWQNIDLPNPFFAVDPLDVLPFIDTGETLTQGFFENYYPVLQAEGGLPNTDALIEELQELRTWIQKYLDLFESADRNLANALNLLVSIETLDGLLQLAEKNLGDFILYLKALQVIPQARPVIRPVLFHLEKAHKRIITPAADRVRSVQQFISQGMYKTYVKQTLTTNENLAEVFMITGLLNNNLIIPPLDLMKNCRNVDSFSQVILGTTTVQSANSALQLPWPVLEALNATLAPATVLKELDDLLNAFSGALGGMTSFMSNLEPALSPVEQVLSQKISLAVLGPFCTETIPRICLPVPCGVKKCIMKIWCGLKCGCSWKKGCRCKSKFCYRSLPCGIKRCPKCTPSATIVVPCYKQFGYTVRQLLKGVNGIMGIVLKPMKAAMNQILNALPLPNVAPLPGIPADIAGPLGTFPAMLEKFLSFTTSLFGADLLPYFDPLSCGTSGKSSAAVLQEVVNVNGTILKTLVNELLSCPFWDALNVRCEDNLHVMFCSRPLCAPTASPTAGPTSSPTRPTLAPTTNAPTLAPTKSPETPGPTSSPRILF